MGTASVSGTDGTRERLDAAAIGVGMSLFFSSIDFFCSDLVGFSRIWSDLALLGRDGGVGFLAGREVIIG